MRVSGIITSAAVLTASALGLAGPAWAEPLSGSYTATIGSGTTTTQTWVFTPCGADCSRLDIGGTEPKELRLQGGTWAWADNDPDARCATRIDGASLSGSTGCSFMTFPVQLAKVG